MRSLARRPERVMLGSVAIGAALVVGKLVVGLLTGSLGILSEAVHSIFDLAASTFTLVAVRTARKPADREHPYGHGRAENLAAFEPRNENEFFRLRNRERLAVHFAARNFNKLAKTLCDFMRGIHNPKPLALAGLAPSKAARCAHELLENF